MPEVIVRINSSSYLNEKSEKWMIEIENIDLHNNYKSIKETRAISTKLHGDAGHEFHPSHRLHIYTLKLALHQAQPSQA